METRVRDWMTPDPVALTEEVSALEAFDHMVERGIRHLPIVDGGRRVVGIVSIDDLRGALPFDVSTARPPAPAERREALELRVSDAMTWAPQTATADASLEEAARTLSEHRIGCLPVVDAEARLIGLLSETDALRALDALLRREAPKPRAPEAGEGVVDALWAERGRLVEQIARWQDEERALSAGAREEPRDAAERASDERGVADLETLADRASRRLRAIERALEAAEHGRLGICERCQGRIAPTRLRALPETTLCVRCARTIAEAGGA